MLKRYWKKSLKTNKNDGLGSHCKSTKRDP